MSKVEWAWAAGLFEGEGSVGAYAKRGSVYPRVTVSSTDLDVLHRLQRLAGGNVREKTNKGSLGKKQPYVWDKNGWDAVYELFAKFEPYLGERRMQQFMRTLDADPGPRTHGSNHLKTHCPRNHEYTEVNTYVIQRSNGKRFRSCKTCVRESRHDTRR